MNHDAIWQRWNWESHYPAPAKLNLFLHVTGRRADGYHLLQTAFRFIDYADRISFSPRSDNAIVLTNPLPGVPPESDLTVRAARLLQAAAPFLFGLCVERWGVNALWLTALLALTAAITLACLRAPRRDGEPAL